MNVIWTSLVIIGIVSCALTNPSSVLNIAVTSAQSAVTTAVSLVCAYSLWMGLLNVVQTCGLSDKFAKVISRPLRWLFGNCGEADNYIALSVTSNVLGLGNASTPTAIKALTYTEHTDKLSYAGAMLFVLNATSVQLLPTTVISMRSGSGSADATCVVLPTLIITVVTTVVAVTSVRIAYK